MEPLALSGNWRLAAAIFMGVAVGFWLVRSELADREKIKEGLQLKDGQWLKTFLFSIAVGVVIFYFARRFGLEKTHVRSVYPWGAIVGGILAGIGVAIGGHVPITAAASLGTGKFFPVWTIIGFLAAIPVVKGVSGFLGKTLYSWTQPIGHEQIFRQYGVWDTAMIWTVGVCLLLTLFLQYALGKKNQSK